MSVLAAMFSPSALKRLAGMAIFALMLIAGAPAHAELDIVEVTSPKGIKAWLVEDETDPMISIAFSFTGGSNHDPAGKEGLSDLLAYMLDEGAGELDFEAFRQRLYETGAALSFSSDSGGVSGTLRMLAGETEEPLKLLSYALSRPRFDKRPLERGRAIAISAVEEEANDPDANGGRALAKALYGDHPLARSESVESLRAIERADLVELHEKMFARSNLVIGVAGAIDPARLAMLLDTVFADLPAEDGLNEIGPAQPGFRQEGVRAV